MSLDDARAAEVTNSVTANPAVPANGGDACPEIQEKFRAIMNSINADRFLELCKINTEAQHGVGLKVDVKQKPKSKK